MYGASSVKIKIKMAPSLTTPFLFLLLAALAASPASAGCYRGRPHAPVPEELAYSANHVAAPLAKHVPESFDW